MSTIGIDFDSHAIYLVAVGDHPPVYSKQQIRPKGGSAIDAAAAVGPALRRAFDNLVVYCDDADGWIEHGRGASRRADWTLGLIAGAIISNWATVSRGSIRVTESSPARHAVGAPGNCSKPTWNRYSRLHWEAFHPLAVIPDDPNLLDAYAIATTGHHR